MVVFKIDILGIFTRPAERDAVISGDVNGPSLGVAVQAVKSKT